MCAFFQISKRKKLVKIFFFFFEILLLTHFIKYTEYAHISMKPLLNIILPSMEISVHLSFLDVHIYPVVSLVY